MGVSTGTIGNQLDDYSDLDGTGDEAERQVFGKVKDFVLDAGRATKLIGLRESELFEQLPIQIVRL